MNLQNPHRQGIFVISLDFELHWGIRDRVPISAYRENLLGVRKAIPAILRLFANYQIHATWATVGFLFCRNRAELLQAVPEVLPTYTNRKLAPYATLDEIGDDEISDPFHFAGSMIDLIANTPGQEIGSHTFSHYYCLEKGQTANAFQHDLRAAINIANSRHIPLKSMVFPRNQYETEYLEICRKEGFTSYRGNNTAYCYKPAAGDSARTLAKRAIRYADTYLPLHKTWYHLASSQTRELINIPASRFLRPWTRRLALLEDLRFSRIKNEITTAAKNDALYHLWWHPHNFGVNLEKNLEFLQRILAHVGALRQSGGLQSLNMLEVSNQLSQVVADEEELCVSV